MMSWLPWRKKKRFDFNAFLVSKAKQQKQEEEWEHHQKAIEQLQAQDNAAASNGRASASSSVPSRSMSLVRLASARVQSFSSAISQPKSFSLVMTDDDLKGLELQRKLDVLKRQGKEAKESHKQELEILKQVLGQWKQTLNDRLEEGIDWSEYLEVAQQEIAAAEKEAEQNRDGDVDDDAGSAAGSTSSVQGRQEADFMKTMHKADMQERIRKKLQEQTNDEILKIYALEKTIKEDFADREAKLLSELSRMDLNLRRLRACHEDRVDVYEELKKRYEQAVKDHVDLVYRSLKALPEEEAHSDDNDSDENDDSDNAEDDAGLKKRRPMPAKSYSERILEARAQEEERKRKEREKLLMTPDGVGGVIEEDGEEEESDEEEGDSPAGVVPREQTKQVNGSTVNNGRSTLATGGRGANPSGRGPGTSRSPRVTGRTGRVAGRGTTTPSSASRTSAIAARSRAAVAAGRTGAAAKPSSSAARPTSRTSNVAPRRVNSATSGK